MNPIETALGRLGSRFVLNLQPQCRRVAHGALGLFLGEFVDLSVGVEIGGKRRVLPLTREGTLFESVHMALTMTSVTFHAESQPLGVALDMTLTAPYWPQDVVTSTAPVFFVDLTVRGMSPGGASAVDIVLAIARPDTEITSTSPRVGAQHAAPIHRADPSATQASLDLAYVTEIDMHWVKMRPSDTRREQHDWLIRRVPCRERIAACGGEARVEGNELRWRVDLSKRPQTVSALWAAHVDAPVFERQGRPHRFIAAKHHASLDSLVAWARDHRSDLLAKSRRFDALFAGSSLSKTHQDFLAFTFQSYLMNTWWVEDGEGRDWFSVWEGCCRFHSTVDVEYNLSMVHFALWPELLEKTFAEWAEHEKRAGPETGWLSHDMGSCQHGDGQDYAHEMEVEENTDFLLLLHALWRWTERREMIERHAALAARLMRFVIAADTTGNGFPNVGVANTIDDASPAVQFAREQTYLAVKAICAARAMADIARELGDAALLSECEEFAARATFTLQRDAWLGGHFAVCLDRSPETLRHAWTGAPVEGGVIEGWDAHSIYTGNGLLLPLMAGLDTGLDLGRMRTDILSALRHARTEYGCTHTSADHSNVWISQNLWRDFIAAHLGVDLLDECDRYWAYQIEQNRQPRGERWIEDEREHRGHCFIDTVGSNCLDFYPRGITAMGWLLAAPGLRIDGANRTVTLRPVRVPLRVPLLPLADWAAGRIPWVEWRLEGGRVMFELSDDGLLSDWSIRIEEPTSRVPTNQSLISPP